MKVTEIIKKSLDGGELSVEEIAALFCVPLFSDESGLVLAASRRKSEAASEGSAEIHGQVGMNIAPCPKNCKFCAFAAVNGVFQDKKELPLEEVIQRAKNFERDGANAVFLMATGDYPFAKFAERSREVRRALQPDTIMIANVGDFSYDEAKTLKEAGYAGVYHAVRLGEGKDTSIPVERRMETIRHAKEVGLRVGTCLEPVGTEHSIQELVEKTVITREIRPAYSGAARRIPLPGTSLAAHGIVSEARMAHILAVVRLALGYDTPANCTHEPNVAGAAAGANLFWAESGSNPRDTHEETDAQRGMTTKICRVYFEEAEWNTLSGPSRFYREHSYTQNKIG
ncbi:MAG: radical SAM protein [Candidatus Omnitrophica bacterium]|nr:radical SAM protein [Candidatus Omnitrophota bacterium]